MQQLRSPFAIILFFFVSLFLFLKIIGPIPFAVNSITTTKTNLFQVDGTGKISALPNTAQISFGVTKQAATVTAAQDQVNSIVSNILNGFRDLGIDSKDVTTDQYTVTPNYNYTNGSQTPTGYSVTQTIQVKISPLEKASKAIDSATSLGATNVNGPTFTFDDVTKQKLQEKARQMAIDDAKRKATSLANATGMKLGNIVDVQETSTNPIVYAGGIGHMTATAQPKVATELPTGDTTITSTVTLSYQTY